MKRFLQALALSWPIGVCPWLAACGSGDNPGGFTPTGNPVGGPSGGDSGSGSGVDASSDASSSDSGVSSGAGSSGGGQSSSSSGGGQSSSSSSSGGSSGSSGAGAGPQPTMMPQATGACPTLGTGTVTVNAGGASIQAQVWAGSSASQGGMLLLYWHGTGSSPGAEVPIAFDTTAVTSAGGAIVGFIASSRTGTTSGNTGDNVWFQSDAAFADQVVACAVLQLHIDPRRIHTAGYSAGGLQTVYMWYARSGYIASGISYSGGTDTLDQTQMQDPSHVPAAIAAHGAQGQDTFGLDFAQASAQWEGIISRAGGFSIDCDDGGNHVAFFQTRGPNLKPAAVQFFKDHPFGVQPEPYTSLPGGFPGYCKID